MKLLISYSEYRYRIRKETVWNSVTEEKKQLKKQSETQSQKKERADDCCFKITRMLAWKMNVIIISEQQQHLKTTAQKIIIVSKKQEWLKTATLKLIN